MRSTSCATVTLRHATRWTGTDLERPLTGRGVREARALVDRFDTGPLGARLRELRRSQDPSRGQPSSCRAAPSAASRRCGRSPVPVGCRSRPPTSSPRAPTATPSSRADRRAGCRQRRRAGAVHPRRRHLGDRRAPRRPPECPSPARWTSRRARSGCSRPGRVRSRRRDTSRRARCRFPARESATRQARVRVPRARHRPARPRRRRRVAGGRRLRRRAARAVGGTRGPDPADRGRLRASRPRRGDGG